MYNIGNIVNNIVTTLRGTDGNWSYCSDDVIMDKKFGIAIL